MIEQVISTGNLTRASHHVTRNKGSAGVDGMPVTALQNYLLKNREQIVQQIISGRYLPQAILGVEPSEANT